MFFRNKTGLVFFITDIVFFIISFPFLLARIMDVNSQYLDSIPSWYNMHIDSHANSLWVTAIAPLWVFFSNRRTNSARV